MCIRDRFINLPKDTEGKVNFDLLDAVGKRLESITINNEEYLNASLDVRHLPSGTYFLHATTDGTIQGAVRFVKK